MLPECCNRSLQLLEVPLVKLRLGLVGLGPAWEKCYRPALLAMQDRFEVRAVFEPVTHRAQLVASEFGGTTVEGVRALAHREEVDALLVLSPGWHGPLPVYAACDAAKAVYLASGLDLGSEEAACLSGAVRRAGIDFVAEFSRRHSPATLRLKELIATALGPPRLVFCHLRQPVEAGTGRPGPNGPAPSANKELIELVDWCGYVIGRPPRWVTGTAHQAARCDGDSDYRMISLDFSEQDTPGTGPVAQISCGRYIPSRWSEAVAYRPQASMQISCRRGIAFLDLPSSLIWFDEAGRHQEALESERPVGQQLLMQFFRAVTSLVAQTSDLDDACRALQIVEAAAESHRQGRRIALLDC